MAKTPETSNDDVADQSGGKGHATPSRKEQVAARRRPLVPERGNSKESRAQERERRDRVRQGMAAGEERYLPQRDKGPQRRFVRDFVDARTSFGEALMPLLVVVLVTYLLPSFMPQDVALLITQYALIGVWGFILLVLIDGFLLGRRITKELRAKFGETNVEKGVRWYAFMRSIQFRPLRLPKPQRQRGDYPS